MECRCNVELLRQDINEFLTDTFNPILVGESGVGKTTIVTLKL